MIASTTRSSSPAAISSSTSRWIVPSRTASGQRSARRPADRSFRGLQSLYDQYADRGLRLLASPSGDFADQEFQDGAEIGEFCQLNYGVRFPLTVRTSVRDHPDPLWQDLGRQPNSGPPGWNFTKYLVGADGRLIDRWPSKIAPEDPRIAAAIESALTAPAVESFGDE
jgi:glutathione peroxidase